MKGAPDCDVDVPLRVAKAGAVATPMPSLPVITVVRLDVARDHVVITEDVRLALGDAPTGDVRLHVAFGAPGVPRALDAHLFAATADATTPPELAFPRRLQCLGRSSPLHRKRRC